MFSGPFLGRFLSVAFNEKTLWANSLVVQLAYNLRMIVFNVFTNGWMDRRMDARS